mgnify:CR=1 FL=1
MKMDPLQIPDLLDHKPNPFKGQEEPKKTAKKAAKKTAKKSSKKATKKS